MYVMFRWWCDCTASWREKWSKVRNERNKARDECKRLRNKLDGFAKDCSTLKKEKDELTCDIDGLRTQLLALDVKGKDIDNVRVFSNQARADAVSSNDDGLVSSCCTDGVETNNACRLTTSGSESQTAEQEPLLKQISTLKGRLDESQKLVHLERELVSFRLNLFSFGVLNILFFCQSRL